jgi:uroporphyrinogen decarboxylase
MTQRPTSHIQDSPTPKTSTFLDAIAGKPVATTPIWFMRQAGRSLPEYRSIRGIGSILDIIAQPDLVTEITLQPVRRYDVDAAVLYSDIMVPVRGAGVNVEIVPGRGPVIPDPIRDANGIARLDPRRLRDNLTYVSEAVESLASELKVPLLGFTGAPYTVASYLIEGGPSKNYIATKTMMFHEPSLWHALMEQLVELSFGFASLQVTHGAKAVQVFDSWTGSLSPRHYLAYVKPHMVELFRRLRSLGVPTIHFGVGTSALVAEMSDMDISVLGLDWRTPITAAVAITGGKVGIQGNLDPAVVLAGRDAVLTEAEAVLVDSRSADRYVFNLGHGVLPETDPGVLTDLVGFVHEYGATIRSGGSSS